jgi:hypothetical protein
MKIFWRAKAISREMGKEFDNLQFFIPESAVRTLREQGTEMHFMRGAARDRRQRIRCAGARGPRDAANQIKREPAG